MKRLVLLLILLCINFQFSYSQEEPTYFTDETCYCMLVIANPSFTQRQKTMLKTPVFELPCTSFVEGIKQDLHKQFFFFLHSNYRSQLEIFKGDVTQIAINPIYFNSKEKVLQRLNSHYGYDKDRFKKEYTVVTINDFRYEKGKYYVNNYPGNELFVIYKQISNYLKNGEEIN